VDILGKARRLESTIARTIDETAQRLTKSGRREPLEVAHAVVDAVEHEVQPGGRGTHVFPFNRLKLAVVAPTPGARARLEAVFEGEPSLHDRIVDRLRAAGCEIAGLTIKIAYVPQAEPAWTAAEFHIEFVRASRPAQPAPVADAAPPRIDLTIVEGSAEQATYAFTLRRIDLGRRVEVRDSRNRLIRTNHVGFSDADDGVNQTISRCHAHIEYAADSGAYRVCDDRSAHGTALLRGGRTIPVPPGARGVRLQSGDEVALGEARLKVAIATGDAPSRGAIKN
jgi:hypothetical protein